MTSKIKSLSNAEGIGTNEQRDGVGFMSLIAITLQNSTIYDLQLDEKSEADDKGKFKTFPPAMIAAGTSGTWTYIQDDRGTYGADASVGYFIDDADWDGEEDQESNWIQIHWNEWSALGGQTVNVELKNNILYNYSSYKKDEFTYTVTLTYDDGSIGSLK